MPYRELLSAPSRSLAYFLGPWIVWIFLGFQYLAGYKELKKQVAIFLSRFLEASIDYWGASEDCWAITFIFLLIYSLKKVSIVNFLSINFVVLRHLWIYYAEYGLLWYSLYQVKSISYRYVDILVNVYCSKILYLFACI